MHGVVKVQSCHGKNHYLGRGILGWTGEVQRAHFRCSRAAARACYVTEHIEFFGFESVSKNGRSLAIGRDHVEIRECGDHILQIAKLQFFLVFRLLCNAYGHDDLGCFREIGNEIENDEIEEEQCTADEEEGRDEQLQVERLS